MPQPDGTGQRGHPKSFRVPPYYCLPFEGLHQEDIGLFSYHLYSSPLCFPPHQTLLAFFPSRRYLLPSMAIFPLSFINADVDPAEEYPSLSKSSFGMNRREAEFIQYLSPVGLGPSLKTCPRCESAYLLLTSVLVIKKPLSSFSTITLGSIGLVKLGHPV